MKIFMGAAELEGEMPSRQPQGIINEYRLVAVMI